MTKPSRTPSGLPGSSSRRKLKRSSSQGWYWVKVGLAVLLIPIVAWLGYKLSSVAIKKANEHVAAMNQPPPNPWPMPPDTPEAELYGGDVGTIVPCTLDNVNYPLRPRSTDPLVKLSNPRMGKSKIGREMLLIDVEVVHSQGPIPKMHIIAKPKEKISQFNADFVWDKKQGKVQVAELYNMELMMLWQSPSTGNSGPFNTQNIKNFNPNIDSMECWAEITDSRYTLRNPRRYNNEGDPAPYGATFKVSPSLLTGTPMTPHPAREWHPDEVKLFRTTGGEVRLFPSLVKPVQSGSGAMAAPVASHSAGPVITAQPIDLLALIDTQKHYISGSWGKRGKDLHSPNGQLAMLELPFQATPSYEMNFEVERIGSTVESFGVAFPIEGHQAMVVFDAYEGKVSGLNLVSGQKAIANPDSYRHPVFKSGKNQITLTVTPRTIVVKVNGQSVVDWKGDPQTLTLEAFWRAGTGKAFMGTWNSEYLISRIDAKSIEG